MNFRAIHVGVGVALLAGLSGTARAAEPDPATTFNTVVKPYLEKYCVQCHGPKRQESDVRLDNLPAVITKANEAMLWRDALSQIVNQVMPPEGRQPRPSEQESIDVAAWMEAAVRRAEISLRAHGGRVVIRQLNNVEYRNALSDLLHFPSEAIDLIAARHALPPDIVDGGFDNHGSVQVLSAMQLEKLAEFVDEVLTRALATGEKPRPLHYEMIPDQIMLKKAEARYRSAWAALESKRTILEAESRWLVLKDRFEKDGNWPVRILPRADVSPKILGFDRLTRDFGIPREVLERVARDEPGFKGTAPKTFGNDFHTGSALSYSSALNIRSPGYYRIVTRLGVAGEFREPQSVRLALDISGGKGGWRPEHILWQVNTPLEKIRDSRYEATVYFEPGTKHTWITEGVTMRQEWMRHGTGHGYIYLDGYTVDGPILDTWPPRAYQDVYFNGPAKPGDKAYAAQILERFAQRALRRPVQDRDRANCIAVVEKLHNSGLDIDAVIRTGLRQILTSPSFLLVGEPSSQRDEGKAYSIDDFALATRLSTGFWRSVPDAELLKLARQGQLSDRKVLHAQVERLLADPRSQRFINNFTDMWLGLDALDTRMPDEFLFPHFDEHLQRSMRAEVRAFFREVLDRDLDPINFLDSDFAMLNERLAYHYGIPGVKGDRLRRVAIDRKTCHRGGLMGMAAVLMRCATDVRTAPVNRGAFILEKLLGSPPPQPPLNVPPLEKIPDTIDGRPITLAEKMALHRKDARCMHCHKQIDPLGMAFEHFDAVGMWRDDQGTPGEWGAPRKLGPAVDAKDRMPKTNTPFSGPDELIAILRKERGDEVAFGVTEHLMSYLLGRSLDFTDRPDVEAIVLKLRERKGGVRTLVHLLVESDAFRRK
ncbi:MAG: DUF1592 domain-containing protein [Planctomycetia bacterium]|nr:DUF1592 domain-containing protein [Planctomycetia bacterium]